MKFTLKIGNNVHYIGSLINCLCNAYGLSDFVLLNHKSLCSTFHYEFQEDLSDYEDNKKYDIEFMNYCSHLLTSKELDKYKRKFRK